MDGGRFRCSLIIACVTSSLAFACSGAAFTGFGTDDAGAGGLGAAGDPTAANAVGAVPSGNACVGDCNDAKMAGAGMARGKCLDNCGQNEPPCCGKPKD
jgi:hypothetical protein